MKRKIIKIHEEKCNGCGLCVTACHERAIELIDGVATLVNDIYCDGLGDCLPNCPTGAIEIVEREALEYDDDAVKARINKLEININEHEEKMPCGCPGTMAKSINRKDTLQILGKIKEKQISIEKQSELLQWPVQIKLVNTSASYLKGADLLIAADCTAYAYGDFHREFIKGKITLIGCPKLDDNEYYKEKLTEILMKNEIRSITVVRMEVPCCNGIVDAIKNAMLDSKTIVPYKEVVITTDGKTIK